MSPFSDCGMKVACNSAPGCVAQRATLLLGLLCFVHLACAGCYRSHSLSPEGASDAGAWRCEVRSTSMGGAYERVIGPVYERTTGQSDPVPLAWSGDGRRLAVGGSLLRYDLPDEEFPPVAVLDGSRPCSPPIAWLPPANPRTGYFAQRVWLSPDGTTATACSELLAGPAGPFPGGLSLQVFRESARGFRASETSLEMDSAHYYYCDDLERTPAALFVQASDGLFAYAERHGRFVELARAEETASGVEASSLVASADGTLVAVTVPPAWTTTDPRVEPVPVHIHSFAEGAGFVGLEVLSPGVDGWPPRGWHVDLAMSQAGDAVVARSEFGFGETRTAVMRTSATSGYDVSPVPALGTDRAPGYTAPSGFGRQSIWISPDGGRVVWISGNERDELTLTIADITDGGIEERWTGFPPGVERSEGCSTPWSALSAAFSSDGRLAVAAWCASASCPISRGTPVGLGCTGPVQVFIYE